VLSPGSWLDADPPLAWTAGLILLLALGSIFLSVRRRNHR
jgi:hypothetical protein